MTETPASALVPEWTLGWRLQRALAHAGVTVGQIAGEMNVSRGTVSRWLNDRGAPPRPIYLKEWALRCGVPVTWLKDGVTSQARAGFKMRCSLPSGLFSFLTRPALAWVPCAA